MGGEALIEYGHIQQQIEQVITRFDSRISQMTPWDSDWAGGTEGSDIRIAKEFNINPRHINHAKEVASEVFPLERAVTPFSEYKLRLGIGIMIKTTMADPDAAMAVTADSGPRKATPGDKYQLPCIVPGEVLLYNVKVGDVLKAGEPLCVLESMKMEMKISVPDEIDGLAVKGLPCNVRTKEKQGDILAPGDLLLELEDAKK